MNQKKKPTVEDVIRLATEVQVRLSKEGVALSWHMTFQPTGEKMKGKPDKVAK